MLTFKQLRLTIAVSLTTLLTLSPLSTTIVKADDTEVFVSAGQSANVLFIFDLSGSMEWTTDSCDTYPDEVPCMPTGSEKSRYQVLVESLTNVLGNLQSNANLRIGLSMYGIDHNTTDNANATGIRWPIRKISEDANLTDSSITAGTFTTAAMILRQLANKSADGVSLINPGGTAIVDSLYEAALYFTGANVAMGSGGATAPSWVNATTSYTGGIDYAANPGAFSSSVGWATASYESPIKNDCDKNYIILLTDGEPTVNTTTTAIENLIGTCAIPSDPNLAQGICGPEIVNFLANTDLQASQGIVPSKVITHTIGFAVEGTGKSYLQTLAAQGGGDFYSASDSTSLEASLKDILTKIASENESFSTFSTSVNASSLSSGNRVFINMFKPSADRSWNGNTKGYFINPLKGLTDINDNAAIDPLTGTFVDTAQSFWSAAADGGDVEKGGLSGRLDPVSRNIFTYTGTSSTIVPALTKKLALNDPVFNPLWFNVTTEAEKDTLINHLNNAPMGDALHANTVTLTYPSKKVLFTMTNQGLMHAFNVTSPTGYIDTTGGQELSAFIPQSLLAKIKDHMTPIGASDHLYGLDGSITSWHDDTDKDGVVDTGEDVYLYFGMRRGGNQYFAINVSNPSQPKLAWRIDGGTAGFAALGQSWSRPIVTTIKWGANDYKKVVMFAGGYDVTQDGKTLRSADTVGNAIYIVDAETGDKLWSVGGTTDDVLHTVVAEMKYSIPSNLTVIDSTDEGNQADRIYVGDMGGQVWRIDLADTGSPDVFRIADFAVNSEVNSESFRRFYSPPSIALSKAGGTLHYTIALGSGFRAHPLTMNVDDRFYMIRDTNTETSSSASNQWTMITDSNLHNATNDLIGQNNTAAIADLANKDGWYFDLETAGEKSLSASLIFNDIIAFNTFAPTSAGDACSTATGASRSYLINLNDATAVQDFDANSSINKADRSRDSSGVGILGAPVLYFAPGEGEARIYMEKQNPFNVSNPMHRINWKAIE